MIRVSIVYVFSCVYVGELTTTHAYITRCMYTRWPPAKKNVGMRTNVCLHVHDVRLGSGRGWPVLGHVLGHVCVQVGDVASGCLLRHHRDMRGFSFTGQSSRQQESRRGNGARRRGDGDTPLPTLHLYTRRMFLRRFVSFI